ncbi:MULTISPECIES: helix-turn-helix domain-containing protein [unclassified Solwaraspora]|uniref:helix-turn-helix domain-containing protein n=1 Tax=unclassified Solwaraspora TaxID=2627926 RepID=UPI00248D375D|nr:MULTISPECIES: helix-turn-helix domain-containing protein [unclassified Solwaraspora]WBB99985.1 helix-turn-helix domain-containing protein [Solwaraspora sp. WMMA2059]WBC21468.1 helix-turn-helix domain-containing protein [Solwaraspora sp. WMMA2080]WJK36453.1 helix-turn-helix domain-containing protein [Solwaraspora sp. WMMA2065]
MPVRPVTVTPWQRLPVELAPAMRPRLAAVVDTVAAAVTELTPEFVGIDDPKLQADVRTAVDVALQRFLDLVGTTEPALPPRVREVFVALGAAEAREDRGPQALLAALRVAGRLLLRQVGQALATVRPVDAEALADCADAVTGFVDDLAAAGTDGFARQLREQSGEGDRARRQLGELLLVGGAGAATVAAAAARAGWRDLATVLPVVLPARQARDARFRFGTDGIVVDRGRDAVLLLRAGPRTTRPALADALRGWRATVGPALPWPQVPQAVRLAELAATVVRTGGADQGGPVDRTAVFAEDHLTVLALHGQPDALAVLTGRRLAPFAALPPAQRDGLLRTLHSWLRHWGSRSAVAADLFIHPQTVSYRLRRLRTLLGGDLDDPDRRFELLVVLAAADPR